MEKKSHDLLLVFLGILAIRSGGNLTEPHINQIRSTARGNGSHTKWDRWLKNPYPLTAEEVWGMYVDHEATALMNQWSATMDRMVGAVVVLHLSALNKSLGRTDLLSYAPSITKSFQTSSWSGHAYRTLVARDAVNLKAAMNSLIPRLVEGSMTPSQATIFLKKQFTMLDHQMRRMLHTEYSAVVSATTKRVMIELGIRKFRLEAVLDERTSQLCEDLNNTEGYWEGALIGRDLPPFHPWCRTVAIPIIGK